MQRTKGKIWEREVAAKLRGIFGEQVRRGWQAREGCDDPDVVGVPRQWVECKHHQRVNIAAAMRQAVEESERADNRRAPEQGRLKPWPVVYSKSNREGPLVTMRMDDFLVLLREWAEFARVPAENQRQVSGLGRAAEKALDRTNEVDVDDPDAPESYLAQRSPCEARKK
jgi:hypothetical protein